MGSPVTAFTGSGASRQITYAGDSGSIRVNVTDNGKPGSGGPAVDDFAISSGSYSANGIPINHGYIVIHHVNGC